MTVIAELNKKIEDKEKKSIFSFYVLLHETVLLPHIITKNYFHHKLYFYISSIYVKAFFSSNWYQLYFKKTVYMYVYTISSIFEVEKSFVCNI